MTPESEYLLDLAKRNLQPYLALPQVRAAMITGSAALGVSDRYSDIDMMIYYNALPGDDELTAARLHNGGEMIWRVDNRAEGELLESYRVQGVECQIAHSTIAAWERDMAIVLEQHDVNTPLHKALSGTLEVHRAARRRIDRRVESEDRKLSARAGAGDGGAASAVLPVVECAGAVGCARRGLVALSNPD